jgi:hypothetical protein
MHLELILNKILLSIKKKKIDVKFDNRKAEIIYYRVSMTLTRDISCNPVPMSIGSWSLVCLLFRSPKIDLSI